MNNNFDSQNHTILIIDDNQTNLNVIGSYLEEMGFNVRIAPNGELGLKIATRTYPDLILLDVMMPGIDGFETCRRLKADETLQDVPVIFMTALSDKMNKVRGFEEGAVDYITKPFQHEVVLARIRTHLQLRQFVQQQERLLQLESQKRQELTELNASKDKFFSVLSHDLCAPFNGLVNLSKLLLIDLEGKESADIRHDLTLMHHLAQDTYNLLNNLLTWSRLQQGQIGYNPEPIPVNQLVKKTISLLDSMAQRKEIALTQRVPSDLLVYVDANMVSLVLRNLISNALKFTPTGGQVTVWANPTSHETEADEAAWVVMGVTDTGMGIHPEDVNKLFRLDTHHTTRGTAHEQGTGLGLILCQEVVSTHGGQIQIESEVGTGSTFTFTVPLVTSKENGYVDTAP